MNLQFLRSKMTKACLQIFDYRSLLVAWIASQNNQSPGMD